MSGERSLLDRLRHPSPERRASTDVGALQDSVLANLRHIFNTRQGQSATAEDYGMPDMTNLPHAYPDSIEAVRRAIQDGIVKYEPRLQSARVRYVDDDDPQVLRFEITAQLRTPTDRQRIRLESVVTPAGRVRFRG